MLHKTRGIAVHSMKFSESSIIVRIYTEKFGLRPYIIKGIRKPHSKMKPGLFQPLTLLDLTVYYKEKGSLQTIREASIEYPYQSLPFDILKSSVALYVSELIYKAIREEEPDPSLFNFLRIFCTSMDSTRGSIQLYPLLFTIQLTRYLGIMPRADYSPDTPVFDLQEGSFRNDLPGHNLVLQEPTSGYLMKLLSANIADAENLDIPSKERGILLDKMLQYYRLHLSGFPGIQSHSILHTVLS